MADKKKTYPLRLRKRHGEGKPTDVTAADGAQLAGAQSLRNALVASLAALVVFCLVWVALTSLTGRVFPWMTVVLGWIVGLAVRRAGRGIDWRFPVLAGIAALAGSFVGNVVLAASVTAADYDIGTLQVLQAVTSMTWPVFFDEVWNVGDSFYAALSAGLAAFLAPRRLTRNQYFALRLWRDDLDRHN
jgi:hypothetical protein